MSVAVQNTTNVVISFYLWETILGQGVPNAFDDGAYFEGAVVRGPVVGVMYEDRLSQVASAVTITMKAQIQDSANPILNGLYWSDVLQEGDWFKLEVIKNGRRHKLAHGKVDTVGIEMVAGPTGAGQVSINLNCRGAGFPLEDVPVYFNPYDPTMDNAAGINMFKILESVSGTPDSVVAGMINGMMGENGVWGQVQVPTTLALGPNWVNLLDTTTKVQSVRGEVNIASALTGDAGGTSVWDFAKSWSNPALNELYVDTSISPNDFTTYLVFREKPFVNGIDGATSPWFSLQTHDIDVSTIANMSVSKGNNRVNHLMLLGDLFTGLGQSAYSLYPPIVDAASIQRYGLKRVQDNTVYFASKEGSTTEGQQWLYLMACWNVLNPYYYAGSIRLGEMRPEIRKGTKIALKNGPPAGFRAGEWPADNNQDQLKMTFYVEGVRHVWQDGMQPISYSEVMVSRGYIEGLRVADVAKNLVPWALTNVLGSANNPLTLNVAGFAEEIEIDAAVQFDEATSQIQLEPAG